MFEESNTLIEALESLIDVFFLIAVILIRHIIQEQSEDKELNTPQFIGACFEGLVKNLCLPSTVTLNLPFLSHLLMKIQFYGEN